MYSITALFSAKGAGAMNATAETMELAHEKAENLKSQGYFVEIRNDEGNVVIMRAH